MKSNNYLHYLGILTVINGMEPETDVKYNWHMVYCLIYGNKQKHPCLHNMHLRFYLVMGVR